MRNFCLARTGLPGLRRSRPVVPVVRARGLLGAVDGAKRRPPRRFPALCAGERRGRAPHQRDPHRRDPRGATLTGATLTSADLTRADLTSADLTSADLTGADLTGADLTGADFSGPGLSPPGSSGLGRSRNSRAGSVVGPELRIWIQNSPQSQPGAEPPSSPPSSGEWWPRAKKGIKQRTVLSSRLRGGLSSRLRGASSSWVCSKKLASGTACGDRASSAGRRASRRGSSAVSRRPGPPTSSRVRSGARLSAGT